MFYNNKVMSIELSNQNNNIKTSNCAITSNSENKKLKDDKGGKEKSDKDNEEEINEMKKNLMFEQKPISPIKLICHLSGKFERLLLLFFLSVTH